MTNNSAHIFSDTPYIRLFSQLSNDQLITIDNYLQKLLSQEDSSLRKTHYFHDRYENIYIESDQHELLEFLMSESRQHCAQMLKVETDKLRIGYWFNLMQPGHVTTLHRHDDMDELMSGVIYLVVPKHSGDLVIHHKNKPITLEPKVGNYIYFDPETPHEVTENLSDNYRLSIGMNIGLIQKGD
mgnify:CR=1 FL=1